MSDHSAIQAAAVDRVIYRAELPGLMNVTSETVRRWLRAGKLPKPDVDLSQRTRGWRLSTLHAAGCSLGVKGSPWKPTPAYVPLPPAFNVYRHFDKDGTLLYIGMSKSALSRLTGHMRTAPWIWSVARVEIERHETRRAALDAERAAIRAETPLFNDRHARRT